MRWVEKYLFLCACVMGFTPIGQTQLLPTETLTVALPLANETTDSAGCYLLDELNDLDAAAYVEHLETRFANPVKLCLTETSADAAALAQSGEAILAWIDQVDATELGPSWRAFLTLRANDNLGRPPYVLFHSVDRQASTLPTPSEIGIVERQPERLFVGMALQTLSDFGAGPNITSGMRRFSDAMDLFSAVRASEIEAGILDSNTWGRNCGILEPEFNPCSDFAIVFEERPRADQAMVIEADQSLELRYRLVSVHIALHLDAPEAFDWLSQDKGMQFQAAEASALLPRQALWRVTE